MVAIALALASLGFVIMCFIMAQTPNAQSKKLKAKVAELEASNRELRSKNHELNSEANLLRQAVAYGLQIPSVEAYDNSLGNAKKAIREEYPYIDFTDEQ